MINRGWVRLHIALSVLVFPISMGLISQEANYESLNYILKVHSICAGLYWFIILIYYWVWKGFQKSNTEDRKKKEFKGEEFAQSNAIPTIEKLSEKKGHPKNIIKKEAPIKEEKITVSRVEESITKIENKKRVEQETEEDATKQNVPSFNFKQYFFYDGSYISGDKYWLRKLLQWPLILIGIGFYLRGVTTYTRSRNLNLSVLGSVVFSIYSFVIDIYILIIWEINDKLIIVTDDMLWLLIIPVLPLTYLLCADGKEKT